MVNLGTPLEVYKLLPKSNCGDCGVSTCLAFAAGVIKEEHQLAGCPHLKKSVVAEFGANIDRQINLEAIQAEQLQELKKKIVAVDLASRAERLGARRNGATIVVKCLGKDFEIDGQGTVRSQCHTHAWFSLPLLTYILCSRGENAAGRWVPVRELENGRTWAPLFERRCEQPLKQIADSHGDLFEDLITLFSGTSSHDNFSADVSVVLYPFPKVPVLICYWKRDADMESKLHLFFDDTAEKNLPMESLFTLGTGLARMLEKIMQKHGSVLPAF